MSALIDWDMPYAFEPNRRWEMEIDDGQEVYGCEAFGESVEACARRAVAQWAPQDTPVDIADVALADLRTGDLWRLKWTDDGLFELTEATPSTPRP